MADAKSTRRIRKPQLKKERGPFVCNQCSAEYMTRRPPGEGEMFCSKGCAGQCKNCGALITTAPLSWITSSRYTKADHTPQATSRALAGSATERKDHAHSGS